MITFFLFGFSHRIVNSRIMWTFDLFFITLRSILSFFFLFLIAIICSMLNIIYWKVAQLILNIFLIHSHKISSLRSHHTSPIKKVGADIFFPSLTHFVLKFEFFHFPFSQFRKKILIYFTNVCDFYKQTWNTSSHLISLFCGR